MLNSKSYPEFSKKILIFNSCHNLWISWQ